MFLCVVVVVDGGAAGAGGGVYVCVHIRGRKREERCSCRGPHMQKAKGNSVK